MDYKAGELAGEKYTIQLSPDDCTGCSLCVQICPAKDKKEPNRRALEMRPAAELRERERDHYEHFRALPDAEVTAVAADLASGDGADELFAAVGELDILVNNLGIFGAKPVLEIDDDEWRRYFEVNVLSAVRLIRHYLPGMMKRGFGRVMNIASDSYIGASWQQTNYSRIHHSAPSGCQRLQPLRVKAVRRVGK